MAIHNRLTSEETELAQKVISIINENISNPELDATQISNLMGISRSGLYLKTKNIFNVSIIELVREIRLTKAIQIMCEGNHAMAEIASKVGFLNQSYFTASFKKKYNMTPTQYIKQLKNETNKKRTYVYFRTQGHLKPNASTFHLKHLCVQSKRKGVFSQEGVFKKITSAVPENSPETADVFVYKIIRILRKPYGRVLQCLLLKSDADYLRCRHH